MIQRYCFSYKKVISLGKNGGKLFLTKKSTVPSGGDAFFAE